MTIPNIIAIDGPAASGKSTLGKRLADALGYLFFDTGVMYRAITWYAIKKNIPIEKEETISQLAESVQIDVQPASREDGRTCDVILDGNDVTWEIRRPEVDDNVSAISAYRGVRLALATQQRRIGLRGHVVMVGRDIGTVVLPEANLKVYLDASAEERARRRYQEIVDRGERADYGGILEAVIKRDQIDSTRTYSPLKVAKDALVLDSDHLSADEVFAKVEELCR